MKPDADVDRILHQYSAGLLTLARRRPSLRTRTAAPKVAMVVRAIDELRQHVGGPPPAPPGRQFLVVAGPAAAVETIERAATAAKRVTGSESPSRNLAFICDLALRSLAFDAGAPDALKRPLRRLGRLLGVRLAAIDPRTGRLLW